MLLPFALVTSNAIGSVPAAMLLLQIWPLPPDSVLYSLALLSSLAGNLLLSGSLSTLLIAERAAAMGAPVSFRDYARAGVPIALISLAFASFWLVADRDPPADAATGSAAVAVRALDRLSAASASGSRLMRSGQNGASPLAQGAIRAEPAASHRNPRQPDGAVSGRAGARPAARRASRACRDGALELVPIRTTGDRVQTRLLAEIGGKGLFTKEIEEALLDGRIDLAVHSLKDMETVLPAGLAIGCVLKRDDPRDVLVGRTARSTLAGLPRGRAGRHGLAAAAGAIAADAPRSRDRADPRQCQHAARQARRRRGRGAGAGAVRPRTARQGRRDRRNSAMSTSCCRRSRRARSRSNAGRSTTTVRALLAPLHDEPSAACVLAERSMLAALDGSCRTPIAGLATIDGDRLSLDALLLSPDGAAERRGSLAGPVADAAAIGTALGEQLRRDAGPEFGFG